MGLAQTVTMKYKVGDVVRIVASNRDLDGISFTPYLRSGDFAVIAQVDVGNHLPYKLKTVRGDTPVAPWVKEEFIEPASIVKLVEYTNGPRFSCGDKVTVVASRDTLAQCGVVKVSEGESYEIINVDKRCGRGLIYQLDCENPACGWVKEEHVVAYVEPKKPKKKPKVTKGKTKKLSNTQALSAYGPKVQTVTLRKGMQPRVNSSHNCNVRYSLPTKMMAIGMLQKGSSVKDVALHVGCSTSIVNYWSKQYKEDSFEKPIAFRRTVKVVRREA